MKLNAEQIKKALECCISSDDCTLCPLIDEQSCPCVLNENALALICEYEKRIEDARSESKTSDITREVLDELERRLYSVSHRETSITGYVYSVVDIDEIAFEVEELKKKYTESEDTSLTDKNGNKIFEGKLTMTKEEQRTEMKQTPVVANKTGYINKKALLDEFEKWNFGKHGQLEKHFADRVFAIIDKVPTADVQEVRRGHWIEDKETGSLICSECRHFTDEIIGDFVCADEETAKALSVPKETIIHRSMNPFYCSKCGAKLC